MATVESLTTLAGRYELDAANSRIGFAARYAMVSTVRGYFAKFSGKVELAGDDLGQSTAWVRLGTASLTTGQAQRDAHLRSPDFLDVETWPEISFVSTGVTAVGKLGTQFKVGGQLTICAVTNPIELDFALSATATDHRGLNLIGFTGTGRLSRADFGLRWNTMLETGGVLVGDAIDLSFDIALIRQPTDSDRARSRLLGRAAKR